MFDEPMAHRLPSTTTYFEWSIRRLAVQVDAHARLQEHPVVGALRVPDQELVELLGDEELDRRRPTARRSSARSMSASSGMK